MEANELRIGNWVHHKEEMHSYRHKENNKDFQWDVFDWYKMGECLIDLDYIEPILLTEEWLLKGGLQMDNIAANIIGWKNDLISISTYSRINVEYYWLRYYQHSTCVRIKYVHELQNLYFALTGQELTFHQDRNQE